MTVTQYINNDSILLYAYAVCKTNKMQICIVNFNFISANDNDNCYLLCFSLYLIYKWVYIQIQKGKEIGQYRLQQINNNREKE